MQSARAMVTELLAVEGRAVGVAAGEAAGQQQATNTEQFLQLSQDKVAALRASFTELGRAAGQQAGATVATTVTGKLDLETILAEVAAVVSNPTPS